MHITNCVVAAGSRWAWLAACACELPSVGSQLTYDQTHRASAATLVPGPAACDPYYRPRW